MSDSKGLNHSNSSKHHNHGTTTDHVSNLPENSVTPDPLHPSLGEWTCEPEPNYTASNGRERDEQDRGLNAWSKGMAQLRDRQLLQQSSAHIGSDSAQPSVDQKGVWEVLDPVGTGGTAPLYRPPSAIIHVAVHLFSGPERPGDFGDCLAKLAWEQGVEIWVENYDLVLAEDHDLLSDSFSHMGKGYFGLLRWQTWGCSIALSQSSVMSTEAT